MNSSLAKILAGLLITGLGIISLKQSKSIQGYFRKVLIS